MRLGALYGPTVSSCQFDGNLYCHIHMGNSLGVSEGCLFLRPYFEGTSGPNFYLSSATSTVTVMEPDPDGLNYPWPCVGNGGPMTVYAQGNVFCPPGAQSGLTSLTISSESRFTRGWDVSASPTTSIPTPTVSLLFNTSTLVSVTSGAGNSTLTAVPAIVPCEQDGVRIILHNTGAGQNVTLKDDTLLGNSLFLDAPSVVLAWRHFIVLESYLGGWYQVGRLSGINSSTHTGEGSAIVKTTDATPTTLYQWQAVNSTTVIRADVTADDGGTNCAAWTDVQIAFDRSTNIMGQMTVGVSRGTNAGEPPAGWALSAGSSGIIGQLIVTGAVATTINWRVVVRQQGTLNL